MEESDDLFETTDIQVVPEDDFELTNYDPSQNKTQNKLSRYEKTTVLIMRTSELMNGAEPYIDAIEGKQAEEIAELELQQKKIPYIIRRNLINHIDYWKLEDLLSLD